MSIPALMKHEAFVLEFIVEPARNMDTKRRYRRRRTADGARIDMVRCRFSQLSSQENLLAGMRGSEVTHRVYFSEQPSLNEENRLEYKGVQYILMGVPLNASQDDRIWQLDVKMISQQNENVEVVE